MAVAPAPLNGPTLPTMPTTLQDFAWPDFDRWQAAFAASGFFPPRWDGLQQAPPAHTSEAEAYRLRKFVLFQEWLDMLTQRPAIRAHYARQGIRARVERQDRRLSCPVCDPLNGREVGPEFELAAVPPFHPGCRCVLMAVHRGPSSRRARL
jgi:hypothetical protein